jgi:ornithine decarboxylase
LDRIDPDQRGEPWVGLTSWHFGQLVTVERIMMDDEGRLRMAPSAWSPGLGLTSRIDRYLALHSPPTPCVVIDLDIVRAACRSFRTLFPEAVLFYAVKANPAAEIIASLAELDANFDVASEGELHRCLSLGVAAGRLSFGNTIKRETEIAYAHAMGVGLFAFDSSGELEKLSRSAPGASVYCRLLVGSKGAEWPLSRKFGCAAEMAIELLQRAKSLGMRPVGVSFHVGSQQTEPSRWGDAIAVAARVFAACLRAGIDLELVNVGGGFPAHYGAPVPPLSAYAEAIDHAITRHFGGAAPRLFVEPGRCLVGDAGILRSSVLLISRKSYIAPRRWVYLDAGRYNGLQETLDERIRYRIRTPHESGPSEDVILAGPTCDSADVIYERTECPLPLDLSIGDPVDFLSAGAYTASYAAVEFNGFPPIRTYCI